MPLKLNGSTSGYIIVDAPAVAGTNTLTLPAATGTVLTTAGGQTVSGTTTVTTLSATTVSATTVNATTIQVSGNQAVNGPAFSAYQSSAQTLSSATFTKIQFQTEEFDTANCFDSTTNYRFTPNVAGYYQITGGVATASSATGVIIYIYKNGSAHKVIYYNGYGAYANSNGGYGSCLLYLNGSTDYVELYCYFVTGQNTSNSSAWTYFQGAMVRGA